MIRIMLFAILFRISLHHSKNVGFEAPKDPKGLPIRRGHHEQVTFGQLVPDLLSKEM